MARFSVCFVLGCVVLCSCAAPQKTVIAPPSLRSLERLTDHERAEDAKKEAPVAWAEGIRYLALAGDALDAGDEKQVDRFANLGLIQIKIALASVERALARARLEEATAKKYELVTESARIQALVDKLEAEQERERIRAHLEMVVDEARRLSLAEDEVLTRDKTLRGQVTQKEELARSRARFEVGGQMISRARLWKEVVSLLAALGEFPADKTILVSGPLGLAEDALRKRNLIELQEHVEIAGVEARRLALQAWEGKEQVRADLLARFEGELAKKSIVSFKEEFGLSVRVDVPKVRKRKKSKSSKPDPTLKKLSSLLGLYPGFAALILGTAGSPKVPKRADLASMDRAQRVADELLRLGVDKDQIRVYGCGYASPILALVDGQEPVAILLFPFSLSKSE